MKILSDDALRRDITRRAQGLVRETLSLDAMGRAYDRCLSEFLEETADQEPPVSG